MSYFGRLGIHVGPNSLAAHLMSPSFHLFGRNSRLMASRISPMFVVRHASSQAVSSAGSNTPNRNYPQRIGDGLTSQAAFPPSVGLSGSPAFLHYVNPMKIGSFVASYVLNYRYYFMFMARTSFQAARPLLAFSVFGEVMKMVLASLSSSVFSFLFSFILAFEVLYFFLQCFISYTFLTMFFTCM
eukprot:GHVS01063048.1.p1 GENE.GHVS01063048.1~~GHVS01063048.1.p1  ORF type:complete len:185 (+),score=6.53 GHVS01063048.1:44-598(+)